MKAATKEAEEAKTGLLDYLDRRVDGRSVRAQVRAAHETLRAELRATRAYDGGLQAEVQSADLRRAKALQTARGRARQGWASRQGRRIELALLLSQLRPDLTPIWAIVDPAREINEWNGKSDSGGQYIAGRWLKIVAEQRRKTCVPVGIPPLPATARKLLNDPIIRKRANWIGVLYQPDAWIEVRPDPAVVVEWTALPGQYYALAVWGGDYHRIMEFVD